MVLMALFTTFITTPIVVAIYKPARMATTSYKYRTIQRKEPTNQLRLLTCFHSTRTIPSLINLMESSRGIGKKLRVYAMHLMELSERSSAILMVHKARKNGLPFWNKLQNSEANEVIVAFEAVNQLSQVFIRPTTAISPLSSMHEDICTSANAKKVAMIILPFHKHLRLDGHLETTRHELRHMNRRVLEHAPCSVGILIDRGLGGTSHVSASNVDYKLTAIFFGGHDDREAVAYGALMAEHPGITLNVVRFILDPTDTVTVDVEDQYTPEARSADEEFLEEFKEKALKDGSITYEESLVSNSADTIEEIRKYNKSNLFLVGRMPEGQLVASFYKKGECPEIGPVGNVLISPDFATSASVLVVQQYRNELTGDSLRSLREEVDVTEGEYDSM